MNCLAHVNCSYLSTAGRPPTLTQLKQHAHSLTVLIKHLSVSTKPGMIDIETYKKGFRSKSEPDNTLQEFEFHQDESYDWLNDLSKPYENDEHHHNLQLTAILNRLDNTHPQGSRDICPLHEAADDNPPTGHSHPYATHQSLIRHANEILELLDHEYGAKGGLLSILPTRDQKEDRAKAEATLLGQLILYMQRLVERIHDLERQYANSLDILAGEALVPHQTLSRLGPKGRQAREVVFPQDRFVLTNAGDDVWQFLQTEFDRKEALEAKADEANRSLGITGEKLWLAGDHKETARGITTLDVTTRYYRVRNDALKTVFVIPAHQEHPGVKVTREMEREPTVVAVVKPVWPERASTWEMRNRENLQRLSELERDDMLQRDRLEHAEATQKMLEEERTRHVVQINDLKAKLELEKAKADGDVNKVRLVHVMQEATNAQKARIEYEAETSRLKRLHAEQEKLSKEKEAEFARTEADIDSRLARVKQSEEMTEKIKKHIKDLKADTVRASVELDGKMKKLWGQQLAEVQALLDTLGTDEVKQAILGQLTLPGANVEHAREKVQRIIDHEARSMGPHGS